MSTQHERLLSIAHQRLASTLRYLTSHADGGAIDERDGLLLVAGAHGHRHAYVNAALRLGRGAHPADVLHESRRFFAERNRPFVLWIRDRVDTDLERAAIDEGFARLEPLAGTPEMVLTAPPARVDPPADVELVQVANARDVEAFISVVAQGFSDGVPPDVPAAIFADTRLMISPSAAAFVACVAGAPAAAAMVLWDESAAEIGFVSTRKEWRSRGLGTLVTAAAARAGFDHGAPIVLLQASPMGEPVYRRMGFAELMRYRRYASPPA